MAWTLHVSGDCDTKTEERLVAALRKILTDPRHGVRESQFFSGERNGPIHHKPRTEQEGGPPNERIGEPADTGKRQEGAQ